MNWRQELKEKTKLLVALVIIAMGFASSSVWANYRTFAPIQVSDITTFIPILVTAEETAPATTETAYYNEFFSFQLSVSGNPDTTTYALIDAPSGMTIDKYGRISWNNVTWGSTTVTIKITDASGKVTTKTLTINSQIYARDATTGDTAGELSVSQDGSAFYNYTHRSFPWYSRNGTGTGFNLQQPFRQWRVGHGLDFRWAFSHYPLWQHSG